MKTSMTARAARQTAVAFFLTIAAGPACWSQGLTYVDADDGFFSLSTNVSPLSAFELSGSVNSTDNLWHLREVPAYEDTTGVQFLYEATGNSAEGGEDVPEVMQTISGLTSGVSYDLYAVYWTNGESWVIQTGTTSGNLTFYDAFGTKANATAGVAAGSAVWSSPPLIDGAAAFTSEDRTAYLGYAGTVVADANGEATLFVDDNPGGGTGSGDRTWWDGAAYIESSFEIAPIAQINRADGTLTLSNDTGQPLEFTSISITSAAAGLDAAEWTTITDNYDQGAAGGVDTDAWEVTAPVDAPLPNFTGALTEIESATGAGGASLASGSSLDLGAVWQDTIYDDVQVALTLASGTTLTLAAQYTGDAHLPGDFDNSGDVTLADYLTLSANLHTDIAGLGQAESYLLGNMNGDGVIDYGDFVAFSNAFPGNLQAAIDAAAAPEPGAVSLLLGAVFAWLTGRRPQRLALAWAVARQNNQQRLLGKACSMRQISTPVLAAAFVALALLPAAQAADVSLNADDGFGASSFNAAGQWSNGQAPAAGNDYFTGDFRVRTPADGGSYTFGGDSLTINNNTELTDGTLFGLSYKGTGAEGTITIDNLILDGGSINHINGTGDIFNLAGSINVVSDSVIFARQGPINVLADVSGSATITNPGSDGAGRTLTFQSSSNTFDGDIINNGRFALAAGANLNFTIGASGVNNSVTGAGAETIYDGVFNLDLSGASSNNGDSWAIAAADNQTFGGNFSIAGFADLGDVWVGDGYLFDTATGVLSVGEGPERLTLRVMSNGQMQIVNDGDSASYDINYYEIRSESGALTTSGWSGIDGGAAPSEVSWEQAGGSDANLLAETNLSGSAAFGPSDSLSLGGGYAGPTADDLEFYYGAPGSDQLVRGYIEFVQSAGLPGDFNSDGIVNAADYTVWRDALGGPDDEDTALGMNGDGSGVVDQGDYNLWRQNYGATSAPEAGATSTPEPASAVLVAVATLAGVRRRRRG
ncbi:hypothetical protein [Posidoniimonas corsicana]|nr:hypothetical protein [Posidoniimonas corsicana]